MSVKLATAYYELIPSMGGNQAVITKEMTGVGGTASKGFAGSFGRGIKSALGPAIAAVGVGAAIGLVKGAVAEAREAQKVGALTRQVIYTTGQAANVTAGQVEKLATSLSNKTGVDDEAIQKGANLLLTFKNVRNEAGRGNKVFNEATKAAVDLSAAGFGSIDSASKMLGKALNDPVKGMTALGRAGVTFTKGQEKQIKALVKSGDLLGAQKIILGEVRSQVGGAAAASATAGEKMKVAWNNAKESLGTALLPAIDALQNAITTKIIPAIVSFIGFLQANPAIVKAFAIGIAAIAAAFVVAFVAANAVVIGIGLLVAALVFAYTKSETFRTVVNAVFKFVWSYIKLHVKLIVAIIKTGIAVAIKIWQGIKAIVNFVRNAFNAAKNFISTAIKAIVKFVSNGIKDTIKFFKELPGKIIGFLKKLPDEMKKIGGNMMQGLIDGIKKIGSKIGGVLVGLLPGPLKKFAGKLGLASPSKLFRQYGEWTVEGYVQGVERKKSTVTPAIAGIANSAISGINAGATASLATASARPSGPLDGGPLYLTVTNWETGAVIIDKRADRRISANNRQGALQARYATP